MEFGSSGISWVRALNTSSIHHRSRAQQRGARARNRLSVTFDKSQRLMKVIAMRLELKE